MCEDCMGTGWLDHNSTCSCEIGLNEYIKVLKRENRQARAHIEALVEMFKVRVLFSENTCPECGARWHKTGEVDEETGDPFIEMEHTEECRWDAARRYLAGGDDAP